jgi:hypothetical protein
MQLVKLAMKPASCGGEDRSGRGDQALPHPPSRHANKACLIWHMPTVFTISPMPQDVCRSVKARAKPSRDPSPQRRTAARSPARRSCAKRASWAPCGIRHPSMTSMRRWGTTSDQDLHAHGRRRSCAVMNLSTTCLARVMLRVVQLGTCHWPRPLAKASGTCFFALQEPVPGSR